MRRLATNLHNLPRWWGRGSKGKGVERKCCLSPQLLPVSPTIYLLDPPQSMRDGCWGREDVCNVDKMSAILNGSGDAAVGVGRREGGAGGRE